MDLKWDMHFRQIVIPNWQDYLAAESDLTRACLHGSSDSVQEAKFLALRRGESAAVSLHHFAEIVLSEDPRPSWFPPRLKRPAEVRAWLSSHCTMLRTASSSSDVALLGDVADALKHSELRDKSRHVSSRDAILVVGSQWGRALWGEGKFSAEQVMVRRSTGDRALSGVIQNVVDAWRRGAGLPLPDIGMP